MYYLPLSLFIFSYNSKPQYCKTTTENKYNSIQVILFKSINNINLIFVFNFVTAETSQGTIPPDTVQCGGCRVSYPLGEILRFIEHKVNHCRNNLQGCHSPPLTKAHEDSDPEDALGLKLIDTEKLNSVPSISAPINKRCVRIESPPTPQCSNTNDSGSPIELRASASSTPKRRTEGCDDDKDDLPKKAKTESVDADTNTINSGKIFHAFLFLFLLSRLTIKIKKKNIVKKCVIFCREKKKNNIVSPDGSMWSNDQ